MKITAIKKWILIGIGEIIICLLLIAAAPIFINSNFPWIGLLIWCFVIGLAGFSALYVVTKYLDARQARHIFLAKFPEYSYLKTTDFLGLSYLYVSRKLETIESLKDDPDWKALNISPYDLLSQRKRK